MALTVVDAAVLVALLDDTDPAHPVAREALTEHRDSDLRLPATAYLECLVGAVRKGRAVDFRDRIADLRLRVEPLTADVADHAAELAVSSRLGLANAVVMATGDVLRADGILTGEQALREAIRRR